MSTKTARPLVIFSQSGGPWLIGYPGAEGRKAAQPARVTATKETALKLAGPGAFIMTAVDALRYLKGEPMPEHARPAAPDYQATIAADLAISDRGYGRSPEERERRRRDWLAAYGAARKLYDAGTTDAPEVYAAALAAVRARDEEPRP